MKNEISTLPQFESFLNSTAASVATPLAVKEMLNGQLQIIKVLQAPTLVDSSLSRIIDGLHHAQESCTDEEQKKMLRREFASMIENLIFFLDAKLQYELAQDEKMGLVFFENAGNLFMDNMRDIMLCSIQTFGTAGKVTATTIDQVGKDILISFNGATSEVIQAVGGTGVSTTTDENGNVTVSTTPISDAVATTIKDTAIHTNDTINSNRGELGDEVSGHIDEWMGNTSDIVIHNLFSEQKKEERNKVLEAFFDLAHKKQKEQQLQQDFYETVCNTIEKLGRYQCLIGSSIVISEMIERYVKVLRKAQNDAKGLKGGMGKLGRTLTTTIFKTGLGVLMPESLIVTVALDVFKAFQSNNGKSLDSALDDYAKIAISYRPDFSNTLSIKLTDDEKKYLDMYKFISKDGAVSDKELCILGKLKTEYGISDERAKEIEKLA